MSCLVDVEYMVATDRAVDFAARSMALCPKRWLVYRFSLPARGAVCLAGFGRVTL
jgi:hypothetical protein